MSMFYNANKSSDNAAMIHSFISKARQLGGNNSDMQCPFNVFPVLMQKISVLHYISSMHLWHIFMIINSHNRNQRYVNKHTCML